MEQIGEGGCGVVFLAEQHEPVRRQVALKVVKPGMDTFASLANLLQREGKPSEGKPSEGESIRGKIVAVWRKKGEIDSKDGLFALYNGAARAVAGGG